MTSDYSDFERRAPQLEGPSVFEEESALIRKLNAEKLNAACPWHDRIFDAEEIPFGQHGVFNPSCVVENDEVLVIARAEHSEATWHGRFISEKATPSIARMTVNGNSFRFNSSLKPISSGMPSPCRAEDWRLFKYQGEVWTNFTTYFFYNEGWPMKDVKSRTCLGRLEGEHIRFIREMEIPGSMTDEEKNWNFFEHDGRMKFIYSIEPFRVFTCDTNGNIQGEQIHPLKLGRRAPKFLANSTNPILVDMPEFGEVYLMLYHYFIDPLAGVGGTRNRTYYQFILLFDKHDLHPIAHTYRPVLAGGMGATEGRHDNVLYASGCFQKGDDLYVLAGEGDTHSRVYRMSLPVISQHMTRI